LLTVSVLGWANAATVQQKGGCVQLLVDYHKCINKKQVIFNEAIEAGYDGRRDILERKFCNLITSVEEDCDSTLKGHCYNEKESNMWMDMNLEVILDTAKSMLRGWDSEKCPVAKAYLKRKEEATIDEGSNSGCKEVRSEFNDCRMEAGNVWVNAMRDGEDGRPHWEARKMCNFETALLIDCPKHLLGPCHTEEQVSKMSFWEMINESDFLDIDEWDSDKCPAVKAQLARWKAVVEGDGSLYPRSTSLFEFDILSFASKMVALLKKAFQAERRCVKNLTDHHDCNTKSLLDTMKVIRAGYDGRRDWGERKMCNMVNDVEEKCGKILDLQCYDEKKITLWNDLSLEVNIDTIKSNFGNWDPEKCPVVKSYLTRKEAGLSDVDGECADDKRQYLSCMDQANKDYIRKMINIGYDGRPNFRARKYCNLWTTMMVECPKKLIGDCFTEEDIVKMSYVNEIDDKFIIETEDNWDSEKCPAVKDHLARWKDVKAGDYSAFSGATTPAVFRLISVSVDILSLNTK